MKDIKSELIQEKTSKQMLVTWTKGREVGTEEQEPSKQNVLKQFQTTDQC